MTDNDNQTLVITSENADTIVTPDEGNVGATTQITNEDGVGRISVTGSSEDAGSAGEAQVSMPEKFANADNPQDALLKAYTELQKKMSGGEDSAPEVTTPDKAVEELSEDRNKAEAVNTYSEMWAKEGSLTDDQWENASKDLNIPIDDLRKYEAYRKSEIATQAEGVNTNDASIYEAAGGQDEYNKMIDWANTKMTDSQIDALNSQLDNPQFSAMGVNMLKNMYVADVGQEPSKSTIDGATVTGNLGETFHSEQEVLEAQKHKDYGKGGVYDKQFQSKLLRFMKTNNQL